MKTLHKVLITAGSLCLVAAIIVVGVFAFSSQTFSISNSIGFMAGKNVVADVEIAANNTGTTIDVNGEAAGTTRTLSFDGEEIVDGNSAITIPAQNFSKRTDYVETIITITNNGADAISATLDTTTLTNGMNQYLDATVTYTLEGNTSSNGATIAEDEVFVITVRITLNSQLHDVNYTSNIIVVLSTAEENNVNENQESTGLEYTMQVGEATADETDDMYYFVTGSSESTSVSFTLTFDDTAYDAYISLRGADEQVLTDFEDLSLAIGDSSQKITSETLTTINLTNFKKFELGEFDMYVLVVVFFDEGTQVNTSSTLDTQNASEEAFFAVFNGTQAEFEEIMSQMG